MATILELPKHQVIAPLRGVMLAQFVMRYFPEELNGDCLDIVILRLLEQYRELKERVRNEKM